MANLNYFDDKNKEFIIKDMYPRRPWLNYFWNDNTLAYSNQFGVGDTFSILNSTRRYFEGGERHVYIKDRKTGEYYSAIRNYTKLPFDIHECHVGLGYQTIISEYDGLHTELTITIPKKGNVIQYFVKVKNVSNEIKEKDIYFYTQTLPALTGHESYGVANYDKEINGMIYSHVAYDVTMPYTHMYLSTDKKFNGYDVHYTRFCGAYNTLANPEGLNSETLANDGVSYSGRYIGVFQYSVSLNAGESFETAISCGVAKNREECLKLSNEFTNKQAFETSIKQQKETNGAYTDTFLLDCPDTYMNSQVNIWLKRQISLGKSWGRLYGKGFRDTLQDLTAFVSFDCPFAKERLLYILKHQFEDGNSLRMFEPNFRYPYQDSVTWIPSAVLGYLNESGDIQVLNEKIPYIKGNTAENTSYAENIRYEDYSKICTDENYTLFDHIQRAMDYLYNCRGKRGLVLLLGGDWNDSFNGGGKLGKGEGVWLTIATVKAYNEFIEILKIFGKEDMVSLYTARRDEMKKAVMDYGYEDGQFIYAYTDYDEKVGSQENAEGKIFLNAQSWAVLGDIADKEILNKAMDKVEEKLICDFGYVQCTPSYTKGDDHIGRISYFHGGNVENGSVYNHGVAFKAVADCLLKRGDLAYQTLKMISCDNPKNLDSGVEPYAVTNMYLGPDNHYLKGYAPHSWITGTAGWVYRCITEYICGVQPTINGLKINPCLPSKWNSLRVVRKFRGTVFEINYVKSSEYQLLVDGKAIKGNVIPLQKDNGTHVVTVQYK